MEVTAQIDADNYAAMQEGTNWGLDALGALESRFDSEGTHVAVIDSGLDAAHAAFARFDFSDNSAAAFPAECLNIFPLAGCADPRLQQSVQRGKRVREIPALQRRGLVERPHLPF
ncbi:MAG: hypothetical protein AAGA68_27485, partial [Pseudomonadota bacterium]